MADSIPFQVPLIIQMFWIHSLCSMLLRHNRRMGRCPVLELTVINVLVCRLVTLCANSSVAFVADDVQIKATGDSVVRDKHTDGAPSSVGGAVFLLLSHCYYSLPVTNQTIRCTPDWLGG